MKSIRGLYEQKRAYHNNPTVNSVHRSSLLVPEIEGTTAEITFLNHFLIKRNYENVGCRITGMDANGDRIASLLRPITEPRVYEFNLSEAFEGQAHDYLVEFFAAENLFIPFPAVIINHRGNGFHNTVHAANRVLNDVFEDDQINTYDVPEAAIDVRMDNKADTFFVFSTGVFPVKDKLHVQLMTPDTTIEKEIPIELPRISSRLLFLKEIFPNFPIEEGLATLKIRQPKQNFYYGRLLAGIRLDDGSITANHSYYDSSQSPEYWEESAESFALYPFINNLDNNIRFYPIMAPSNIDIFLSLYSHEGKTLANIRAGNLTSPGNRTLDISVNDVVAGQTLEPTEVASFCVWAKSELGELPTRVNHQLIYRKNGLGCSINTSLTNEGKVYSNRKGKIAWGQLVVGGDYNSWLGLVFRRPSGAENEVTITYYDTNGKLSSHRRQLPACGSIIVDVAKELFDEKHVASEYIWFTAECERQDLTAWSVVENTRTGHCSGEHSF